MDNTKIQDYFEWIGHFAYRIAHINEETEIKTFTWDERGWMQVNRTGDDFEVITQEGIIKIKVIDQPYKSSNL